MSEQVKVIQFLKGARVYLRPLSLADTDLYSSMLYYPEARRLTGTQKTFTKEQIARYIEAKGQDNFKLWHDLSCWFVVDKHGGTRYINFKLKISKF
ncbi:hypothetical protein [Marinicrinis lubricantis]|uniref:N-acetyltransferase domain-containing protein n=1 Tax=Marinicrinis lubricantis TaxID=2086470 RepID=A0ABW1IUA2_9BACL